MAGFFKSLSWERSSLRFYALAAYLVTAALTLALQYRPRENGHFISPPEELAHFTLGYREVFADSAWLRVIQNFDYCENAATSEKSVNKGTGLDEILTTKLGPSRCHLGWVYQMINVVSTLAPRFRMAQATGATILSIAVDDREGARRIFDKAVQNFPDDWSLSYRAAYHYLYEMQDAQKAADLLTQAAKNGGPVWLSSLAARLYSKSGQYEIAKNVLLDYIARDPEGPGAERAKKRLSELEAQWAESQKKSDERLPAKVNLKPKRR